MPLRSTACAGPSLAAIRVPPARRVGRPERTGQEQVWLRTNQRTFNSRWMAIVVDRSIWVRPNTALTGAEGPWQELTELPDALAGDVQGIALDDRFLMATNSLGRMWQMWGANQDASKFDWHEYNGMPFGMGQPNYLPPGVVRWDVSVVSPEEDGFYTDPAGNHHEAGSATCTHWTVLKPGGRWLGWNDAWLPPDLDYEVCGPERGGVRAVGLSTSGSTWMVMSRHGELWTRLWDYDIGGGNVELIAYSYEDQTGSPNPARQLPPEPWRRHPRIDGVLTSAISLHKVGQGCVHRIMRVEGLDAEGHTGFYERDIAAAEGEPWVFHRTDQPLVGRYIDNLASDAAPVDLAPPEDLAFARGMASLPGLSPEAPPSGMSLDDWAAEIPDFNAYCSPSVLRVHLSPASSIELVLHTTEALRGEVRLGRGLDDDPRPRNGTIEIPASLLDGLATLDAKAARFLDHYLYDPGGSAFTEVAVAATRHEVRLTGAGIDWPFTR